MPIEGKNVPWSHGKGASPYSGRRSIQPDLDIDRIITIGNFQLTKLRGQRNSPIQTALKDLNLWPASGTMFATDQFTSTCPVSTPWSRLGWKSVQPSPHDQTGICESIYSPGFPRCRLTIGSSCFRHPQLTSADQHLSSALACRQVGVQLLVCAEDRSSDPNQLVRQGRNSRVLVGHRQRSSELETVARGAGDRVRYRRSRFLGRKTAQIPIDLLTEVDQPCLGARDLPRHQPESRRQLPATGNPRSQPRSELLIHHRQRLLEFARPLKYSEATPERNEPDLLDQRRTASDEPTLAISAEAGVLREPRPTEMMDATASLRRNCADQQSYCELDPASANAMGETMLGRRPASWAASVYAELAILTITIGPDSSQLPRCLFAAPSVGYHSDFLTYCHTTTSND